MEVSVFTAFFLSPCLGNELSADTTHNYAPGGRQLLKTLEQSHTATDVIHKKGATIEIMPLCMPVRK